jgi:Uma2 family endonuclease
MFAIKKGHGKKLMTTMRALEKTYLPLPRKRLPTMYDLPSENPEDPGLPDDFHYYQPQLLRETFTPPNYPSDQVYVASDLNLYYDVHHPTWYKRPDWFAVLGVPKLYKQRDLRMSYVTWQEKEVPFMAVELLSEGTEKEDLGQTLQQDINKPPTKWEVYERQLRIPYYVVYSRSLDEFQAFQLWGRRYRKLTLKDKRLWLLEINLGLGLWHGVYHGVERQWLRWYDSNEKWISTPVEKEQQRAEQERKRAEQEQERAERLAAQLRALGIDPDV